MTDTARHRTDIRPGIVRSSVAEATPLPSNMRLGGSGRVELMKNDILIVRALNAPPTAVESRWVTEWAENCYDVDTEKGQQRSEGVAARRRGMRPDSAGKKENNIGFFLPKKLHFSIRIE